MSTGILKYFSPATQLPSYNDTGIKKVVTGKAKWRVKCVLEMQANQKSVKKRKMYTNSSFSDTDTAEIGWQASKNGNAATQWHASA